MIDWQEIISKIVANAVTIGFILPVIYSIFNKIKNRIGEIEDKQDATIEGLKNSRALNGQFRESFEKALAESRRKRSILNKDVKIINE